MNKGTVEVATISGRPVGIDLFAGAGGLALGFEQAGFDIVSAVEYDPVHAATHAFNFPHTKVVCADASRLSGDQLLAAAEEGRNAHARHDGFADIDVIFGGPPCQGFSTIGKRLIDDERNALVFHFFRLVAELRPRYFVMENVPGIAQGGHSGILSELVEEFSNIGYAVTRPPRVLNAADFGVPQDRRRIFLLGSRNDQKPAGYPQMTARRVPAKRNMEAAQLVAPGLALPIGPTVSDAISDLPNLDSFAELLSSDSVRLSKELASLHESRSSDYAKHLRGTLDDPTDFSYPRVWDRHTLTSSRRTEHSEVSVSRFANTHQGDVEPVSRFLRLSETALCNTLRAGTASDHGAYTSPRPIHPNLPRVISVREAARLHSFPDWFRFHQTKWHGFRQVGNSVPPLLGRAVARQIILALGCKPTKPKSPVPLGDPALLALSMKEGSQYFGSSAADIPRARSRPNAKPPSKRALRK